MGRAVWLAALPAVLLAYFVYSVSQSPADFATSTEAMIRESGYPCETHKIQTEDGYILTAFRIPHGKGKVSGGFRPPFWLQHGLTGSSDLYVQPGSGRALAFLLADKEYDVWIGNARGNRYSNEHIRLKTDHPQFWDFSWDEMGRYDLPAAVSHVLSVTKKEKMFYAGHSLGTAMLMVLFNTHPEYQARIELAFGLAPAVYAGNSRSVVVKFFCQYLSPFIMKMLGAYPLFPGSFPKFQNWLYPFCSPERKTSFICEALYTLIGGPTTEIVPELLQSMYRTSPSQVSVKTCSHYGQSINTGQFRAFDYGEERNLEKYGSTKNPEYHLKNVSTPIAIMFSDNDYVSTPPDQYELCKNLGNVVEYYRVPVSTFNHLDFICGRKAKEVVYNRIFEILDTGPRALKKKASDIFTSREAYILSLVPKILEESDNESDNEENPDFVHESVTKKYFDFGDVDNVTTNVDQMMEKLAEVCNKLLDDNIQSLIDCSIIDKDLDFTELENSLLQPELDDGLNEIITRNRGDIFTEEDKMKNGKTDVKSDGITVRKKRKPTKKKLKSKKHRPKKSIKNKKSAVS